MGEPASGIWLPSGGAPVRSASTGQDRRRHRSRGTARAGVFPPFAACCCKRSALAEASRSRHATSLLLLTANQETFLEVWGIYGDLRIT